MHITDIKFRRINTRYFTLLSIIVSLILSEFVVSLGSLIFRGKIYPDYLIIGAVASFIFSFSAVSLFSYLSNRAKRLGKALNEHEDRCLTLLEKGNNGIVIIQNGLLKFANSKMAEMVGFSKEELTEKPFIKLVPQEYKNMIEDSEEDTHERYEVEILSKENRRIPAEMVVESIECRGEPGKLVIIRDLTREKQAEKELKETQTFFEKIIDAIAEPVMVIENDFRVKLLNTAARGFLPGDSETPFLCYKISHGRDTPCEGKEHPCPLVEVRNSGKPEVVEHVHQANGKERYVEIVASPFFDSDGNFVGIIESMRDITERKHAEEAIKKYAKELEEVNRLKDTFLDIMHHDLLNPLGTAMGYLDILMDTEDPEIKSELEVVNRNISRAIDLIESATRLSKLQSKNSLELEDINLREIIDRCIENFSYEASKAGMKIENRITRPISVKANKIIEEVFSNLISNAIKYASEGTKVIIEAEEKENSLRVKVKDFGKGINDSSKLEIFERFRRKEKRSIKGSGLGLAIASRIVELHSGKIWVEDNPEGGAVFVVEIPKK